uniref:Uncharacterized protein n=1 Tax=Oryza glumipatula TaxID=40148 RepID=A0A0D9ZY69_9ORYZ
MERRPLHLHLLLFFSAWLMLLLLLQGVSSLQFRRDDFPDGFAFGAGTAAYQYEGAAAEDGRTPSIWDTYTHSEMYMINYDKLYYAAHKNAENSAASGRHPEDGTGDVASDGYHKYKEDVKLMTEIGLEAYRFTISWSRLIPSGRGAVNPKGLQFYNNMINELVKAGIQIQVVLYHSDLPQSLQDEYGGWINPKIVDDFTAYADVCFREFGDRVAHWTTVLEPNVMAQGCYDTGILPPNHCSYPFGSNCTGGNSTVEPYLFIHHNLLAHASAVRLYREKYQVAQKGIVGINMYSLWFYPLTDSAEDIGATERAKQFMYGWILHPLVFGDYPETIKKVVGSRLPFFSNHESELVTNAFDFVGLNHYSSVYTSNNNNVVKAPLQDLTADIATLFRATKNDTPTPEVITDSIVSAENYKTYGNTVDPQGLENALEYIRENYGNLTIYIQENGSGAPDGTLDDVERINYLQKYIAATLKAIRNGANVKGYSMWSFIDIYEIFGGYNSWHYGLVAVDFGSTERRRQPRRSASWYSDFLKNNAPIRVEMAPLNGVNVDQYEMFGGYKAHFGLVAVDFGSKELRRQPSRSARWCSDFLKNNAIIKPNERYSIICASGENAMETRRPLHLLLVFLSSPWLLLLLLLLLLLVVQGMSSLQFTRDDFPHDFAFGAGTSAYQYEGGAAEDGRTPSIWDTYTHSGRHPEDETDVKLMSEIGLEAYRFTISWSRLIPSGRGAVNLKALQFYNSMINELIHVVMYHMDLPQSLQDEYGGWISPKIVDDFTAYADVCFREFGDRVAHWTTVLEPNAMAQAGYDMGILPPNRCSYPFGSNCTAGNSSVEPYLFIHHSLLAHASAVRLYREKYKVAQKGIIGINIYSMWFYPFTDSAEDIGATERAKKFIYGWILHPLVFGDYPDTMKKAAGSRLPIFSNHESEMVTNSFDFIGLNHYSSVYTSNNNNVVKAPLQDLTADVATLFRVTKNDTPTPVFVPGTIVDPRGLEHALKYIREKYGNLPIYIQENGSGSSSETLDDVERINYLAKYIAATLKAIRSGANVKGYSMWSFVDLYELFGGYSTWHFGLVAVDFNSEKRRRQPRRSASWYSEFLKNNSVIRVEEDGSGTLDGTLDDVERIDCLAKYIAATLKAIRNGANVKGYSVWSFMDLYELFGGYNTWHYGLIAVDFSSAERRRQPRRSASWYSDFLKNNAVIRVEDGSSNGEGNRDARLAGTQTS